jgi:signal transduction histidine kinase/ActR/RegA family two-component response regulator
VPTAPSARELVRPSAVEQAVEPPRSRILQAGFRAWRWLRPRGLERDRDASRRADRVLGFTLALIGFCPLFFVIFLVCRAPIAATVVCGALVTLVLNVWALRQTGRVDRAALILVIAAWITYTLAGLLQGGHGAPGLVWYATVPMIATVLLSSRAGLWNWLAGAVVVTVFYVLSRQGVTLYCEFTPAGLQFIEYTGLLGLMLCTLALTVAFVSMERAAEREIATALVQAETADRTKSEFLANMSHEIRTPLNAILGFTDLMLDEAVEPEDLPDVLRTIKRNGEHLLKVISEILDLSKIESGQMTVERLPCDPADLVQEVLQLVRSRAEPKRLQLLVQLEGPIPAQIMTDPTRLKQILLNLVGNAVKFTERGSVTVRLCGHDTGRLQFVVIDTGIGLTEEQRGCLFKAFSQGDTSMTRRFGGTGLGLVISQQLARLLGGEISVESQPGQGSRFTLTLEHADVPTPRHQTRPLPASVVISSVAPVLAGRRLLVAEDMPDNRRLIEFLLGKLQIECVLVEDGASAVETALSGAGFDLILMDMQMPGLNGYEATRQLRERGCTLPIIALTANSSLADRDRCLDAGCDDHLGKPIQREQLHQMLTSWLVDVPAAVE